MKAALRYKYCSPAELKVGVLPDPIAKAKEVVIKVHATTVNRTDLGVLTGKPYAMRLFAGLLKPKGPITGTDFAGVIETVGDHVSKFKPGDLVWGFFDDGFQTHAEYMRVKEDGNIDHMPTGLSFQEAAASLEGAHYARMHLEKTQPDSSQRALVNGATGAIGSATLQMLKNYVGMEVTAVCHSKNDELIKSLGADQIFNYDKEDFTKIDETTYDYIFDSVGKSSFGKCKPLLNAGGMYTSSELGPGAENIYLPLTTKWKKKKMIFPLPKDIKGTLRFMKELVEADKFRPVIDRTLPLEDIVEAFEYVASGEKIGNVVIDMDY